MIGQFERAMPFTRCQQDLDDILREARTQSIVNIRDLNKMVIFPLWSSIKTVITYTDMPM